jgi:hypothetical protein
VADDSTDHVAHAASREGFGQDALQEEAKKAAREHDSPDNEGKLFRGHALPPGDDAAPDTSLVARKASRGHGAEARPMGQCREGAGATGMRLASWNAEAEAGCPSGAHHQQSLRNWLQVRVCALRKIGRSRVI